MILEGLVTTRNADGSPHLAPMGPRVGADFTRFTLRPFPTSGTYRNLLAHPEGVLHVTDDAFLIARAALGAATPLPPTRPAAKVAGFVLADCCRHYEFVVTSVDATGERVTIEAEVVHSVRHRDFWGFNRAKHAVVEAAILATRLHLLPRDEVAAEFRKLRVIVGKTGGPDEHAAMDFLDARLGRSTSPPGGEGCSRGVSSGLASPPITGADEVGNSSPPFPPREEGPGGLGCHVGAAGGAPVSTPLPAPPPGGEGCSISGASGLAGEAITGAGPQPSASPPFPSREGGPGGLGDHPHGPGGADVAIPPPAPPPEGEGCSISGASRLAVSASTGAGPQPSASPPF
ncbi:MAG TPA: DUF447 domain-containing protein, partial [Urbifossiella sp.]|nr:DUF447 domain-containing protein [Urbifossiella sp.]